MKILAVDAGRGTQDILIGEAGEEPENFIQLILPARTVLLARRIGEATKTGMTVVLRGVTMGGGPITKAARRHVESGGMILATPSAAATFSDDPVEVAALGVRIVGEEEAVRAAREGKAELLETADVHLDSLRKCLAAWGLPAEFDAAAVAVQDHGAAPPGESDRRYRFAWLAETLAGRPSLPGLCFTRGGIPGRFTRMLGVEASLPDIPRLLLMDTGFAALLGACLDPAVAAARTKVLVNAGNGHTLAALVEGTDIRALFEHHTRNVGEESLAAYLEHLERGSVENSRVYEDGGHGAWHDAGPFPEPGGIPLRAVTGPRRRKFAGLLPPLHQAAPFGAMMLTGSYGLLAAILRRHPGLAEGWDPAFTTFAGGGDA